VTFVGDDLAEAHHDVYVCDQAGTRLAMKRLPEGIEGMARFHDLVATHADGPGEVIVGTESDRGLWVQALVEAGYVVYAINPKAASRYRDRHTLSGAKSDPGDAKILAERCALIATITARSRVTLLSPRASRSSLGRIRR
jgi:transposase